MVDGLEVYQCHKTVRAGKIKMIVVFSDLNGTVVLDNKNEVKVDRKWLERHRPMVDGYLVQYKDGYLSYSPGPVFEEGYSKINKDQEPTTTVPLGPTTAPLVMGKA
jgi:hypothetical protein